MLQIFLKKNKILQNLLYKSYVLIRQFLNPTQKSDYKFVYYIQEWNQDFIFDGPKYEQKNFTI